jgi:endonuclease/exonuclease/phosphatase family metal-dependent hydrolase
MFARRLSAFLALALIGWAFAPGPASAVTPLDLRVMEFNIEYGGTVVSFDSIVRAVQAADADVVGVEELRQRAATRRRARVPLLQRSPPGHLAAAADRRAGDGADAVVVLPGDPVQLGHQDRLIRPVRRAKRAESLLDQQENTTILEIERRVRVPAVEPAVTALTGLVDQGIPAMLLGDFNTPSRLDWTPETVGLREQIHYPVNWPTSRFVEGAGFVDSYRAAHPDPVANPGLTWPSGRPHRRGLESRAERARRSDRLHLHRPATSRPSGATWSANRVVPTSRSP